jgi:polyisoprenoid-binding protein YceI
MSATQTTETTDRIALPTPGTWSIDPVHAEIGFVGRHLGLARVRGRFTDVDGVVEIGTDPSASTIAVVIDMASVQSGSAERDHSLRSPNLFDVEHHPTARFRSTAVTIDGTRGTVVGDLTIKGVTRPVTLDVEYLGAARDPWGSDRAAFTASATIDREDWGLTWNLLLDNGVLAVSKLIRLEIELELIRV